MNSVLLDRLALINDILQAAVVIFGASVALYNIQYVRRDRVIRAFTFLLAFVVLVYFTELLVSRTEAALSALGWLRLEWLGICFVPAAQFDLSSTLLVTTGSSSRRRRWLTIAGYALSALFYLSILFSGWIVQDFVQLQRAAYLEPGPLFPLFAAYYWLYTLFSIYNAWRAYLRCITTTTRRRMRRILVAILAAPLSVFPYLTARGGGQAEVSVGVWLLLIAGNLLVAGMYSLLTANLVYFGAVSPDRVVRVRLYKFMARVPMTATLVLLVYVVVGRASPLLGLNPDTMRAIGVVATVMLVEWAVHAYKRPLERVLQLNNEPDVRRIQTLSERLLTPQDLRQFLESVLAATCDALRTPTAFVTAYTSDGPQLEAIIGARSPSFELEESEAWPAITDWEPDVAGHSLIRWQHFWLRPLYDRRQEVMLGLLGIAGWGEMTPLTPQEHQLLDHLARQAEAALEDRLLQQGVFAAVEGLLPEITALQQRRGAATYEATPVLTAPLEALPPDDPEFIQQVWDALNHYWGGPKLTESPLLSLQVVQSTADAYDGNPVMALRAILKDAIDQQKPDGEQSLSRSEWLLYNILELKFVQGKKVRDIARRLAMSESDLYRKQRIAIENVARAITDMENRRLSQL